MSDEERKRKKRRIKLRYSSEGKKKRKRKYQRRKENKKEKKKLEQAPQEPPRHPNYVPQSKHIPYRRGLGKQYGESRRHDGLESSPSNSPGKFKRYSDIKPKEYLVESPSPSPISDAAWVRKVLRCSEKLEFGLRVNQELLYLSEQYWYRDAAASINAASQNKILSPTELEEMLVNYTDAFPYPVDLVEKMLEPHLVCVCLFVYLLISLNVHLTLSIIIYTG